MASRTLTASEATVTSSRQDIDSVCGWIVEWISARTGVPKTGIDARRGFRDLGLSSLMTTALVSDLAQRVGQPLSAVIAWEHGSPQALARHVVSPVTSTVDGGATRGAGVREPIAIVGMGCRFPQGESPRAFWKLLTEGRCAIADAPAERWRRESSPVKRGAFLNAVDRFDAGFFGISPREAEQIDPQQRLALELAWEALEDAHLAPHALRGSRTGVFMGIIWSDYSALRRGDRTLISAHTGTGQSASIAANRISYCLGLEGPSLSLDTACSSALVAVHLACRSLWSGESTRALAGGVNLMLSAETMVLLHRFGGLSPDGASRAFDAAANGFVRGEGGGIVVLEPLSTALRDGHDVYCVIRGSAMNNDGASNGLTAPNPRAQEAVLRAAYADAAVEPRSVDYVEAHGTGTPLGDPIEARSLGAVLGAPRERALRVGSVKTNIGHLEGAAGIAGLCKAALALRHGVLPPSLGFATPNPHVSFSDLGVAVQTACEPWPRGDGPARAGVSAFGWGGTNCHVVLEEAPRAALDEPIAAASATASAGRVALVFSPQGGHWPGMARELLASEPAFRAAFAACDRALRPYGHGPALDRLAAGTLSPDEGRADVVQPLLFAMQIGLAAMWEARGLRVDAVVGHSLGEIAAACVAGVLSLEDAACLVHHYSRLQATTANGTAMAVVELDAAALERELAGDADVEIAAFNGPRSTVISGRAHAVDARLRSFRARALPCSRIQVDVAAHTPHMDRILPDLGRAIAHITTRAPRVRFVSTSHDGAPRGAEYWLHNLREPVRFAQAIASLAADRFDTFVEVHPHPVLGHAIAQAAGEGAVVLASSRRDGACRTVVESARVLAERGALKRDDAGAPRAELVVLSAQTPSALQAAARGLSGWAFDPPASLASIAYTTALGRTHLPFRAAFVASDVESLRGALASFADDEAAHVVHGRASATKPRVVFVFPGQGSQWLGMGRALLRDEAVFREAIARCEAALAPHVDWSLRTQLEADEGETRLGEIDVIQPTLFAVEVALAALWRSWGIEPDVVVGHSMGEVAAAHVAGILSLEEAARIIAVRSKLLRRVRGKGAMLLVELPMDEAATLIAAHADQVSVAVSNGVRSTVLAGDRQVLSDLADALRAREVFTRWVKVDVASHSPQMDPLTNDLRQALEGVTATRATTPMLSTVTGGYVDGPELTTDYWVRNLRQPVLFAGAVRSILAAGGAVFVEQSPHPILLPPIEDALRESGVEGGRALPSMRRGEDARTVLLGSLGALYVAGAEVDGSRLHPAGGSFVPLPTYPWERERYWIEGAAGGGASDHPLLGTYVRSAEQPDVHAWQFELGPRRFPYLADHGVDDLRIVPGATYSVLAIAAAQATLGAGAHRFQNVQFRHPLFFTEKEMRTVQVVLTRTPSGATVKIYSRQPEGTPIEAAWMLHVVGEIAPGEADAPRPESLDAIRRRCTSELPGKAHYERAEQVGIYFGPSLVGVEHIWSRRGEALARVAPASAVAEDETPYPLHPVLVDLTYQALLLSAGLDDARHFGAFVPGSLGSVQIFRGARPGEKLWAYTRTEANADRDADGYRGDLWLLDDAGEVVLVARALRFQRLNRSEAAAPPPLLVVEWERAQAPAMPKGQARNDGADAPWLLLADRSGTANHVQRALESRGHRCVVAHAGDAFRANGDETFEVNPERAEDFARLLGERDAWQGIAHLWSLDAGAGEPTLSAVRHAQTIGAGAALAVAQALARRPGGASLRVVFVTRGVHAVTEGDVAGAPSQAPVWGFARSLAYEMPDVRSACVDLGGTPRDGDGAALAAVLLEETSEREIALRGDDARYVARLARATAPRVAPPRVRGDATYLVTGGLGAIGLAFAKWLVEAGARHLVLVGRSAPTATAAQALEELRAAGARVRVEALDVADPDAVAAVVRDVATTMPPLRGVLHAAGILDDATIPNLDASRLRAVMRPKVDGAWNLHLATKDMPLDFFVACSSAAALIGNPGQSNYAAANAFLDALAHARRASGRAALSVDWGAWATAGLAARDGRDARLETRGIGSFSPRDALDVLGRLLATSISQAGVLDFDFAKWCEFYPAAAGNPLFRRLASAPKGAPARAGRTSFLESVTTLPPGPKRRQAFEQHLREHVGHVLRLPPARVELRTPLVNIGLDSLMTLELRNRLEVSLGVKLPATVVWAYPTIEALSGHLAGKLGVSLEADRESPRAAPPRPAVPREEAPVAANANDGDDDVLRLFDALASIPDEGVMDTTTKETTEVHGNE